MKKITIAGLVFILAIFSVACVTRGATLYYTSDRTGQLDIYSTVIGTDEEINVTDTPALDEYDPVISPDGNWLAFRVGDQTKSSIDVLNISNNNRFTVQVENETTGSIEVLEVIIPDGNYTSNDLELFLNTTYFCESGRTYGFVKLKFTINKLTLKDKK